jgi:hypothetical protein
VIAVAPAREQPLPNRPKQSAPRMTGPELCGLACVLCHRRLPPTWRAARLLDVVEDSGQRYDRWACAPACAPTLPKRVPTRRRARGPILDPDPDSTVDNSPATMQRVAAKLRTLPDTRPPP